MKTEIQNIMLSEREYKILELRNGWDGQGVKSLQEVAKVFAVTRERIRQIEAKALDKLRSQPRYYEPKIGLINS